MKCDVFFIILMPFIQTNTLWQIIVSSGNGKKRRWFSYWTRGLHLFLFAARKLKSYLTTTISIILSYPLLMLLIHPPSAFFCCVVVSDFWSFSIQFSFFWIKKKYYWIIVDLQCCVNFCCQQSDSVIHTFCFSYSFPLWFFTDSSVQSLRKLLIKIYIHGYVSIGRELRASLSSQSHFTDYRPCLHVIT